MKSCFYGILCVVSNKISFVWRVGRPLREIILYLAGRKVRAGQGAAMANSHSEKSEGKCHRKYTACCLAPTPVVGVKGKGEKVFSFALASYGESCEAREGEAGR